MTLGFRPCPRILTMFKCENSIALNAFLKKIIIIKVSLCLFVIVKSKVYVCFYVGVIESLKVKFK